MKKAEANNLKDIIKKAYPRRRYTAIYSSIKEELRVWVYYYGEEKPYDEKEENNAILYLLNSIADNGIRPKYRIERKKDQGTNRHTYICFR